MSSPTVRQRVQQVLDTRHGLAAADQWVAEQLPGAIAAQIRAAVTAEREAIVRSIKVMLRSALEELGVISAASDNNPNRWSDTDLATDLEPILQAAIRGRGPETDPPTAAR